MRLKPDSNFYNTLILASLTFLPISSTNMAFEWIGNIVFMIAATMLTTVGYKKYKNGSLFRDENLKKDFNINTHLQEILIIGYGYLTAYLCNHPKYYCLWSFFLIMEIIYILCVIFIPVKPKDNI